MLFSIYSIEDKLIVASGGGDKKFGVKNKITLYQLGPGSISKALKEENFDQIPEFIEGIPSKKIFGICSKNKVIFYSLSGNDFQNIYTLTLNPEDISLTCFKIYEDMLATADDSGCLTLFKISFNNNQINSINEIGKNDNAHVRGINKIAFFVKNKIKFLLTASQDGTCKIFGIDESQEKPIKMNTYFCFRQFQHENSNYFMRDLIYVNKENIVYTLQSLAKGKTFLTKWDASNVNSVKPIETIMICNDPCFSFDIDESHSYLGIADSKGNIYFVDAKNMVLTGSKTIGENMLKDCRFYKNYLVTGNIGNELGMNKIMTGFNFKMIRFLFYAALIFGIYYYIYLRKNNLIDIDN